MELLPGRLLFFSGLITLAATGFTFVTVGGISPISVYFFGLTILASLLSLTALGAALPDIAPQRVSWAIMLGMSILCFWRLGHYPMWLDEDMQIGRLLRTLDTFHSAAMGQQPPSDYFLARLSFAVLGHNLFAMRFFSALVTIFCAPLFLSLLKGICRKKEYAWVGTIFFSTSFWVRAFAHEGRPYALGLFSFLLFLHACRSVFFKTDRLSCLSLFSASILFLLSLGLQPLLLVSISLAILPLIFRSKGVRTKSNSKLILAALGAALLLFTPVQGAIMANPENHLRSLSHIQFFLPDASERFREMLAILGSTGSLGTAILGSLAGTFFFLTEKNIFVRFLLYLSWSFLIAVFAVFMVAIEGPLRPRYLFLLLPLAHLLIFTALDRIEPMFKRASWQRGFCLCAMTLALAFSVYSVTFVPRFGSEFNWLAFYKVLETRQAKGAAFVVTLDPPGRWALSGFMGFDLYDFGHLRTNVLMSSAWDEEYKRTQAEVLRETIASLPPGLDIFFFCPKEPNDTCWRNYTFSAGAQPEFLPVSRRAEAVRLSPGKNHLATVLNFFRAIEGQEKSSSVQDAIKHWIAELEK